MKDTRIDVGAAWCHAVQQLRKSDNPESREVYKHLTSYQFKISQEILGERISQCLTPQEAAAKCGMSEAKYRSFENAINMSASKKEYRHVYDKLARQKKQPTSVGLPAVKAYKNK